MAASILTLLLALFVVSPAFQGVISTRSDADHHCTIDPNGGPCSAGAALGDGGSFIDPNG